MATKIRGFSADAQRLIEQHPGMTAQEIFRQLRLEGKAGSAAQDPQGSLVATLHKHHRNLGVERRYEGGAYHFYPKGYGGSQPPPSGPLGTTSRSDNGTVDVRVRLPKKRADLLDGMIIANASLRDRSDAILWLIDKATTESTG